MPSNLQTTNAQTTNHQAMTQKTNNIHDHSGTDVAGSVLNQDLSINAKEEIKKED